MSDVQKRLKSDLIAQQWQSLAERRRAHLLSLHRTGRWRKYYSEDQILAQMRDLERTIKEWDEVSREGKPPG